MKHTEEFYTKKAVRAELKLKKELIMRVKAEDPRYFLTEQNIIRVERLPEEVFKLIPTTTRYYVSNKGRALKIVYNKKTDTFEEHLIALLKSRNKTHNYYYDINIQLDNDKRIRCRLSRAIVKTFIDPSFGLLYEDDKRVPNHIDYNTENNNLTNLEIKSQSENIEDAIYGQGKVVGVPIKECYAYNIDTGELRKYVSTGKLTEDIFKSNNNGYFNSYNKAKSITKEGWTVGYEPDELKTRIRRSNGTRKKI